MLDGEVLGVLDDGTPRRFQDTMGDFGADTPGRGSGLAPFFFDVLHIGGDAVVAEPLVGTSGVARGDRAECRAAPLDRHG